MHCTNQCYVAGYTCVMIHVTGVVVNPYMGRGRPHMYLSGVVPIYGRSEHNWLSKEDTSSSAVSTEGLIMTLFCIVYDSQYIGGGSLLRLRY